MFLRARHYDPTVGRFVQKDAYPGHTDETQSLNRYAYAHGNPLLYKDPSGHGVVLAVVVGGVVVLSVYDIGSSAYMYYFNPDATPEQRQEALHNLGEWVTAMQIAGAPGAGAESMVASSRTLAKLVGFVEKLFGPVEKLLAPAGSLLDDAGKLLGGAWKSLSGGQSGACGGTTSGTGITLTLTFEKGMNPRDFERKVAALRDLAERGKLARQISPVTRDPGVADAYKASLRERISKLDIDQERRKRLYGLVKELNADHVQDLQLMGVDGPKDLWLLDPVTNQGLGRQIWQQIRNFPPGTPIDDFNVVK